MVFVLDKVLKFLIPSHRQAHYDEYYTIGLLGYPMLYNLHVVDLRRRRTAPTTAHSCCNHLAYPENNSVTWWFYTTYKHSIRKKCTVHYITSLLKEVFMKCIPDGYSVRVRHLSPVEQEVLKMLKMLTDLVTGVSALLVVRQVTAIETAGVAVSCGV